VALHASGAPPSAAATARTSSPTRSSAAFEDARAQAAVAAHGVEAAGPERVFHARAGIAIGHALEQHSPMRKRRPLSATSGRPETTRLRRSSAGATTRVPRQGGDRRQVLGLDQRDAAIAAAAGVAIAGQALAGRGLRAVDLAHRHVAARAQADPLDAAGARQVGHQSAQRGIIGRQRHAGGSACGRC
jgi:hypothetical protein